MFEEGGQKNRVSKMYYLKYLVFINNNNKIGDMEKIRRYCPLSEKQIRKKIKTVHEYDYILK